jgi:hypothetical protein
MKMSYNVRIFNENGKLKLGFVHGAYKAKLTQVDKGFGIKKAVKWKDVPENVRTKLAKKMNLELV